MAMAPPVPAFSPGPPSAAGGWPVRLVPLLTAHLVVALVALVAIGGATRVMEAGLACPDWPLCYGVLLPGRQMNLQVFLEWFHRLDAFLVGVALLVLFALSLRFRARFPSWLPWSAGLALALVALQGGLGALTVLSQLAAPTVTLHLATALSPGAAARGHPPGSASSRSRRRLADAQAAASRCPAGGGPACRGGAAGRWTVPPGGCHGQSLGRRSLPAGGRGMPLAAAASPGGLPGGRGRAAAGRRGPRPAVRAAASAGHGLQRRGPGAAPGGARDSHPAAPADRPCRHRRPPAHRRAAGGGAGLASGGPFRPVLFSPIPVSRWPMVSAGARDVCRRCRSRGPGGDPPLGEAPGLAGGGQTAADPLAARHHGRGHGPHRRLAPRSSPHGLSPWWAARWPRRPPAF